MSKITLKDSTKTMLKKAVPVLMCAATLIPMATFCDVNLNATPEKVMNGVLDIIFQVAKYVGIVLSVSGVFQLVMAYKDDNADGQSRAVRLVVVGLLLLGLKTLVKLTGLLS